VIWTLSASVALSSSVTIRSIVWTATLNVTTGDTPEAIGTELSSQS